MNCAVITFKRLCVCDQWFEYGKQPVKSKKDSLDSFADESTAVPRI